MANINVVANTTRIFKVREYLFTIIDSLLKENTDYQINANFLGADVNNYSIDRLPIDDIDENWIITTKKFREVYELRSRSTYSQDVMDNIKNTGFFEELEKTIDSNNKKGILPDIEGIESVKRLNVGSLSIAETTSSIFSIQIEIKYLKNTKQESTSL